MNRLKTNTQNHVFSITWMVIITIASCFSLIITPLDFAFKSPVYSFELILEIIICTVFAIDLFFRWKNIYQIKSLLGEKDFLFHSRIDKGYKTSIWPIFDVLCALPIELIAFSLEGHISGSILAFFRLMRVFRIFKLRDWKSLIDFIPKALKLLIISSAIAITLHFIACGWMMINPRTAPDDLSFYIISLYWAVTTLTTVGYGDITPVTNVARLYTMGVMIVGVGVYGVIIGNISRLMMLADKYTEQKKEKLHSLNQFMKHYNIPSSLQRQVFSFYGHLLNKNLAQEDYKIINELPQALQNELNVFTKIKLIRNVHIFSECSTPCLKMIAERLEQTFHSPNEYIIKKGDVGEEMFILGHGKVQVCSGDKVLNELQEGQFFGEVALIENTVRNADVQSIEYCDLYTFKKSDFLEVIEKYPTLGEKFRKVYSKRKSDSNLKQVA